MDQTEAGMIQPIAHASNRLVDSLDAPALILLLFCFALGFIVWQMWKRIIEMTDKFINISEKTHVVQERLCTLIEGRGSHQ